MLSGKKYFPFIWRQSIDVYYRLIENVSPEKAVQLYQQAASVFEVSGGIFVGVFRLLGFFFQL